MTIAKSFLQISVRFHKKLYRSCHSGLDPESSAFPLARGNLDPHKLRKITIVGSKKMVVFDDMEVSEKLKIYDKGVGSPSYSTYGEYLSLRFGDITIPNVKMVEPLRAEAEHFVRCTESRIEPKTGGRDGLKVVKILMAAQKSLKGKGVPIALERG